jgi:hypothetical protein
VGQQLTNLQYTTLVGLYPTKESGNQDEKDKQLKELKQTHQMVSFVMDVAAELTKITQFAEKNFNKLPATPEANNSAHYCFGFEEGNDITASALKGTRQ